MKLSHKFKSKGSLIAALDVGSTKVACFIGRVIDDAGAFEVLGVGNYASAGVRGGAIVDIAAAESIIRQTVHAAENMAADVMRGYPLREVVVNLPGMHARSYSQVAEVQIAGHEVTEDDVRRAMAKAQEQSISHEYELVHTVPVGYRIDGHDGIREPRGMYGQNMEVDIHMVAGEMGALRNMASCTQHSHLDIEALCVSSYAAGLSSLVQDEMDLGCTVIDMGGGVTSISVFHDGALVFSDAIPIGGHHVTNDIAKGLTTSLKDAERLKILYGSAIASVLDENELIDVPQLGEEDYHEPNHVPRSILVGIVQPRLEEIFELIRARLQDSGLGGVIGRRVVLTGGASQLAEMKELAAHVLDKQVRLGKPVHITGLPDAVSGPAYATTAGLLAYVTAHEHEMPAQIMRDVEQGSVFARFQDWLKENW